MTAKKIMQMALDVITTPHPGLRTSLSESMIYREKIKMTIEALRTALSQPEPEPVAWAYKVNKTWEQLSFIEPPNDAYDDDSLVPLYTAPPQRKPLSDDELLAALKSVDSETARLPNGFKLFARAIEAAHGIGEEK